MPVGGKIKITKSTWYTPEAQSPAIPTKGFSIELASAPATRDDQPTMALLASYRLQGRFGEVYGGRVHGAITVVAFDAKFGKVYFGTGDPSHTAPMEASIDPDATPPPGEPKLVSVEGQFNLDLADKLGLPPEEATYTAFAWIDDVLSAPIEVTVPKNPNRHRMSGPAVGEVTQDLVTFEDSDGSLKPQRNSIALRWEPGDHPDQLVEVTLYGMVAPDLLPAQMPPQNEPPPYLALAAIGQRTRELLWNRADVPEKAVLGKSAFFKCPLKRLVRPSEKPQRAFVVAMMGDGRSDVLAVDPANPPPAPRP